MKLLSLAILSLFIFSETVEAKAFHRARRRVSQCKSQVAKLPNHQVDCSQIIRERYIPFIVNNSNECNKARTASSEEITQIAKDAKFNQMVIEQCFGKNLEHSSPEERTNILKLKAEFAKEEARTNNIVVFALSAGLILFVLMLIF